MTRTMVLLMTLVVVLPLDGSAQAVPSPGDRIRIEQVDGTVLTGTLATVTTEAIRLSVDSSRVEDGITIRRSQIATLERQEGTRSRSGAGSVIGLLAGGVIAVATLKESPDDCELGFPGVVGCASEDFEQLLGDVGRVALGVVAGAVGGYLIGSAFRTENWVVVPLIEVAPTRQGTSASVFGFGLRFRRSW